MKYYLFLTFFIFTIKAGSQILDTDYIANNVEEINFIKVNNKNYFIYTFFYVNPISSFVDSAGIDVIELKNNKLNKPINLYTQTKNPTLFRKHSQIVKTDLLIVLTDEMGNFINLKLDSNFVISENLKIDSSISTVLANASIGKDSSVVCTFNYDINKYQFYYFDNSLNLFKKETFQDSIDFSSKVTLNFENKLNLLFFNHRENIYSKKVNENVFQEIGNIHSQFSVNYRPYVYSEDSIINFLEYKDSLTFSSEFYSILINTQYSLKTKLWSKTRLTDKSRVLRFDYKHGVWEHGNNLNLIYTEQSQYNTANFDTTYNFILGTIADSKLITERKIFEDHGIVDAPSVFENGDEFIMVYKKRIVNTLEGQKEKFVVVIFNNTFDILSTDEFESAHVKNSFFYPNPASNILNFKEPLMYYSLYSIEGKVIQSGIQNTQSLNVSPLKPGIYLIEGLTENGQTIRQKFVKE